MESKMCTYEAHILKFVGIWLLCIMETLAFIPK